MNESFIYSGKVDWEQALFSNDAQGAKYMKTHTQYNHKLQLQSDCRTFNNRHLKLSKEIRWFSSRARCKSFHLKLNVFLSCQNLCCIWLCGLLQLFQWCATMRCLYENMLHWMFWWHRLVCWLLTENWYYHVFRQYWVIWTLSCWVAESELPQSLNAPRFDVLWRQLCVCLSGVAC